MTWSSGRMSFPDTESLPRPVLYRTASAMMRTPMNIDRRAFVTALAAGALAPSRATRAQRKLTKMSAKTFEVEVIGAGVFGAWTAWHLQKLGRRVALLDAYGAAHSRASSGGESRVIRMGYGGD